MCGIIGIYRRKSSGKRNQKQQEQLVKKGLALLKRRGRDCQQLKTIDGVTFGHALHAVVQVVPQPLVAGKPKPAMLTANNEIYNWKELSAKFGFTAINDSGLLLQFLQKEGVTPSALEQLGGVFALGFYRNGEVFIARDILGEKPVWYSQENGFAFASERKVLLAIGYRNVVELNPRTILRYNKKKNRLFEARRPFFEITPQLTASREDIRAKINKLFLHAVQKRIPETRFGLLFSGGIDSTIIAQALQKAGKDFTCYLSILEHESFHAPGDLTVSIDAAAKLGLKLKIVKASLKEVEKNLRIVAPLIEDTNVTKVAVALTFFKACEQAKKDGCKVIFSGLGSEEIFGGYSRHRDTLALNRDCVSGLLKLYERDLYRDDVITMFHTLELRLPFLDKELVSYAVRIPPELKRSQGRDKMILRDVAHDLGIPPEFAERKKIAAQYGSNILKGIEHIVKSHGFQTISSFLETLAPGVNPRLGVLLSTGKDSMFALSTMKRQNYPISCLITIRSKNKDSFMFHTPTVSLAALQAKALNLPLVIAATKGKKEEELIDLRKAFHVAKRRHRIEGIVTGALFSNYQRDRIEKIADELSLKIFSPLWHIDQGLYIKNLIREHFEVIITHIAADGFSEQWLGRKLDAGAVEEIIKLSVAKGMNPSFEGGEAETLVLDCPLFEKKIVIDKKKKIMENPYTGTLIVEKAHLEKK